MFCVIQKVVNKKANPYGAHKELLVDSFTFAIGNNEPKVHYTYKYSKERFERPIKDAYKISIHKSYRENGKIKKKQWVICTMGYYEMLDSWPGDFINSKKLKEKLDEIGITEEELWDMVYKKLDPIIEQVKKEFESTEEYKVQQEHKAILEKHRAEKMRFEEKYGANTYEYCYDIFGQLKNEEYLKKLEQQYTQQQEYKKQSSYYNNSQSNYNDYSSSYYEKQQSNYTDDDKEKLKRIYRALSKTFHPDITKDDGEMMKFINKLKEGWNL